MKKTTYTFNIGLNVGNEEPEHQEQRTLELARFDDYKIIESSWGGIAERTIVGIADFSHKGLAFGFAQMLCKELRQDAIAISDGQTGTLVYNPQSARQFETFDSELFTYL